MFVCCASLVSAELVRYMCLQMYSTSHLFLKIKLCFSKSVSPLFYVVFIFIQHPIMHCFSLYIKFWLSTLPGQSSHEREIGSGLRFATHPAHHALGPGPRVGPDGLAPLHRGAHAPGPGLGQSLRHAPGEAEGASATWRLEECALARLAHWVAHAVRPELALLVRDHLIHLKEFNKT